MSLGKNLPVQDKLIRKTTAKQAPARKTSKTNIIRRAREIIEKDSLRSYATDNTVKMTFYVKAQLLKKLYNFAYWERLRITDAFNTVLEDGLKGKNTKPKPKE